jgi:hypothetical protein
MGAVALSTSVGRFAVHAQMTPSRLLLIVLTLWGLFMIVPDVLRVAQPLSSFGFYADSDGRIYNVTGPFDEKRESPAWKAGMRAGDKLDLARLKCSFRDLVTCGYALAAVGGVQYVLPGRTAVIPLMANHGRPARQVALLAEQRPANFVVRAVVLLSQIAGIIVVIAAAWLVWTQPSAMSWGFFLYVNWFNPGQAYAYYAILQQWPLVLLAQDIAGCFAQAIGYAGLLLFVLRAPNDVTEPRWRPLEKALPFVALAFALALTASYGSVLGYRTEVVTRAGIVAGFPVALCALGILLARRRTQKPEDYQRLRWVIWGCLIGLPAFLIAELAAETTIFHTRWGDFTPTEDIVGLLYLVNGVLCLFVFEALRRPRVVSVTIPLRRVTILGLSLSVPVLLLHHEMERIQEHLALPGWAWITLGAAAVFALTRLHEGAVHLVDGYFNREIDAAGQRLGQAIREAKRPTEIDRLLADGTYDALKLASAASFRREGAVFARDGNGKGWDRDTTTKIKADEPMLAAVPEGKPFPLKDEDGDGLNLPSGLSRPVLAVPAVNPVRCFAVSLYGPHASGTDLDVHERGILRRLADEAAAMYAELENTGLRGEIARLERKLDAAKPDTKNRRRQAKGSTNGDL